MLLLYLVEEAVKKKANSCVFIQLKRIRQLIWFNVIEISRKKADDI
jgi:hypothetical protein